MAAEDDFIELDTGCDSDHKSKDNGVNKVNLCMSISDCFATTSETKEEIPNAECIETFHGNDGSGEDVSLHRQPILHRSVDLVESVTMMKKADEVEHGQDRDNNNNYGLTITKLTVEDRLMDESPTAIAGVKRARVTYDDQQPSVHIVYRSLTRESKKKLMELMQQWSKWHAQHQSSCNESSKEVLEYGEETYYPALHIGLEKSSTVTFWLDNQSRKEDNMEHQLENESVPLYDRGCLLGSTLPDGSANQGRIETLEASRCFNCGSYTHGLKECTKARDNVAIGNARKQHNSKRNQASGSRGTARYYQKSAGKFEDLRPGVLGAETRESLGIGEFDPPPWLQRMRELGYPPGYLDIVEDEDKPSGIEIVGGDDAVDTEYEDGELPEMREGEPPEKTMSVDFPGINAPIPGNADHRLWSVRPVPPAVHVGFSGSNPHNHHSRPRSGLSSDSHRGDYGHDRRWPMDDGPPGVDYVHGSGYSPRYSPYDTNPVTRSSPNLGRSLSDRGLRSGLSFESSPVQSPHSPYPYSPTQYQSLYGASPDISSSHSRDRYDHRHNYHNHHHHRR